MQDKFNKYIFLLGLILVIWISMLIAPSLDGGLKQIIKDFSNIMENPFSISWCSNSLKTIIIFSTI